MAPFFCVWYTRIMDTIDILEDWLRHLPQGTKIQSPAFEGHTWVKDTPTRWSRGRGSVSAWNLLGFSLRWKVVP